MSDAERITALEERLAQAEFRIALLEARPLPLAPLVPFQPLPFPQTFGGYACSMCKSWIPNGTTHTCAGFGPR